MSEILETTTQKIPTPDDFYVPRNFARSNLQAMWTGTPRSTTSTKPTIASLNAALSNPFVQYKQIQEYSNYLLYNSAMYGNFLDYLSNLITWDYVLYSDSQTKVKKSTLESRYYDSAKTVSKLNLKTVFPYMLKRVLANGEMYFYNSSTADGNSIITEVDSSICQLAQIDESNLWRYYVNVSLIDPMKLCEFPIEIQEYYEDWISLGGKRAKKKDKTIDGVIVPTYLYLVSKNGFAIFAHMRKTYHDYPYLAPLFEDLNNLESDKDYMDEYAKQQNIKLIHMKVPTDPASGLPIMPKEVIEVYHNSAKEHLPSNVAPLTNPFETEGITLDTAQTASINLVEHSTKVVVQDSGISESVFNASSTLGLQYSTEADAVRMYPLMYFFENFVNYILRGKGCKVKFLQINIFNRQKWHENYRTDLLSGGSRSLFVASAGIEPFDMINLAKTETTLDMDAMLPPKLNASQIPAEASSGGAPEKDPEDSADSTNIEKGYR